MSRGNNEFFVQKEFLSDFTIKQEGHTEETMPPDPGTDVTEGAEVDNTDINAPKAANIKASDNTPSATSTTMSKELEDIPDKAEGDIVDGYVSDVQHLPGPGDRETKGFEQYNEMVAKGVAVDTCGLSKYNINAAVDAIEEMANKEFDGTMSSDFGNWMSNDLSIKGFDNSMIVKMEGNAAPEDEEANEGLTEDSEGVGKTKEETDEDKGKQGENTSKPQTGGSNQSFSEGGPEEEKGLKSRVAGYAGRAADYAKHLYKAGKGGSRMGYHKAKGVAARAGIRGAEKGKAAREKTVKWVKANPKKALGIGAGIAAGGAGITYMASGKKKKKK